MKAHFYRAVGNPKDLPKDGLPEIAFAGRSNVGKSSLINTLLGQKRLALTSSTPGKTRTINFYRVEDQFYLVDLPGYGFAKVSEAMRRQWRRLIESYFENSAHLRGAVVVVDARHDPTELDVQMATWLKELEIPFVVAATKVDKLSVSALQKSLKQHRRTFLALNAVDVLPFSAVKKTGKRELWHHIWSRVNVAKSRGGHG